MGGEAETLLLDIGFLGGAPSGGRGGSCCSGCCGRQLVGRLSPVGSWGDVGVVLASHLQAAKAAKAAGKAVGGGGLQLAG